MSALQTLRQSMCQQRQQLDNQQQAAAGLAVADNLQASGFLQRSNRIAFYWAVNGELGLMPAMELAWSLHKHCYLPVLDTITGNRLWFVPYRPDTPLSLNRYKIPEPVTPRRQWRRARALDLILVPLVAFDNEGNRVGMGGGFYDRTLAFRRRRLHWHRPLLVGVGYEFQKVNALNSSAWDIPMDAIITDEHVYR
jgi:5-formyltetrahydrofolate cyclo-ligase